MLTTRFPHGKRKDQITRSKEHGEHRKTRYETNPKSDCKSEVLVQKSHDKSVT